MSSPMIPPIAASRTTAIVTETGETARADVPQDESRPKAWTLGDILVAGLSVLSLVFAVVGVLIAVG